MDEPVRVLQHVRILDSGGIEAFIFANLRAIDRDKVNFDFLVTRDQEEFYDEELKKLGCKKIVLEYKHYKNPIINPISQALAFYKFCKKNKHKYNIIHFESIGANGFLDIMAAKFAGVPFRIAHSHIAKDIKPSSKSENKVSENRRKFVMLRQAIIRKFVTAFSTDYYGCSKMACEWMFTKKINDSKKAIVVKNPINVSKFKFNEENRLEIRNKLKINDKKVFGHVGRFVYSKNHMFLLEAFANIRKDDENAVLVLVGSGKLEKDIINKIKELGLENDVILYGTTTEVYKVYSAFDVFLFPSIYEGLGIVLVEAQANGLPVLAADTIPAEVEIASNFKFLPITNAKTWSEEIKTNKSLLRNNENYEVILNSGYDIKDVSRFLQESYLKMNESRGISNFES